MGEFLTMTNLFMYAGSFIGALLYVLSRAPKTSEIETAGEILIQTGLGSFMSFGIGLMFYDFFDKELASIGLSMLLGTLGSKFTSSTGKRIILNLENLFKIKDLKSKKE